MRRTPPELPGAVGFRVYSRTAAADFHAFQTSGNPGIDTYAPWGFSTEP
jgi:hypothetical protein